MSVFWLDWILVKFRLYRNQKCWCILVYKLFLHFVSGVHQLCGKCIISFQNVDSMYAYFSLFAIGSQLSPEPQCSGIELLETDTFKLHCMQTMTGELILLNYLFILSNFYHNASMVLRGQSPSCNYILI